ncbi:DUF4256 domain-containing protein [Undibacterium flavidum]|uniref:DUF4256 domain-containing protein n=1 Tax=Undibacterium flavidum TaxID=2762297 RepID=A0ABR6YAX8_9BURK|nr:DUF4256 domain-containing protein [Undibacterium flavidum]MBC3873790.1 DUF4256 domain-containing protein [Undibacterium flavidum]
MPKTDYADLLSTLKTRFEKNKAHHQHVTWADVEKKLAKNSTCLAVLMSMEQSGGEPDVVDFELGAGNNKEIFFCDCAAESPSGRRSVCYDRAGLESRKEHQPADSAVDMANAIGVTLLSEEQYRALQSLGEFDKKTSSWIQTPAAIRALGGALFCDRRYDHVFVYHNGAQSYYSARGFRGVLKL